MLKILVLIVLISALAMPLLLARAPRSKRSFPTPLKLLALALIPFLPRWLKLLAQSTQGPACPRCGMTVGRRVAACPKCGNVMTTVRYKVNSVS